MDTAERTHSIFNQQAFIGFQVFIDFHSIVSRHPRGRALINLVHVERASFAQAAIIVLSGSLLAASIRLVYVRDRDFAIRSETVHRSSCDEPMMTPRTCCWQQLARSMIVHTSTAVQQQQQQQQQQQSGKQLVSWCKGTCSR